MAGLQQALKGKRETTKQEKNAWLEQQIPFWVFQNEGENVQRR